MFKRTLAVVAAFLLAATSVAAFARGGGGGSGIGSSGGLSGGMSSKHMGASGLSNTNGPNATDRDKGLARAEDRQSAAGASHEKAMQSHGKRKSNGKSQR